MRSTAAVVLGVLTAAGYVIALNQSAAAVEGATINVLGANVPPTISVWNEGRAPAASGNGFTDSFGPYEVHAYEF